MSCEITIMRNKTRTQSQFMCFEGERRVGVRLRPARGLMGRDEGKISFARDVQVFFKGNSTFLVFFFCSISFVTSIYLLLTIKKVSKKYFYAFSGVLVVSPAWLVRGKLRIPGKAWTISMVLFIVNCAVD